MFSMRWSVGAAFCALLMSGCACGPSQQKCSFDIDCGVGNVCGEDKFSHPELTCAGDDQCPENSKCIDARCYARSCFGGSCFADQVCVSGTCTDEACVGTSCPGGQVCAKGLCLDSHCSGESCASKEFCSGGACTSVGCAGKTCPAGHRCAGPEGTCYPNPCGGPSCGAV
jgi:hypothetical protein